jgi:multidrug efflux pump subunit AcrB
LNPPQVIKEGAAEPLMQLAISSKSLSPTRLADVVNNQLQPMLKAIPEVQTVDVEGTTDREFHVMPVPSRIVGTNATILDVFNAVAANNANLPGGLLTTPTQETSVSIHSEVNQADDLLGISLPVPGNANKILRVGDVAVAEDGHVEQRSFAHYNGKPLVQVTLYANINADQITTTKVARDQLKKIEALFPDLTFNEVFAPANSTQRNLNGVGQSLAEGIVLTMIVMLLFLHAWRNAVVVMVAIPTSILSTFIVMNAFGYHLDSMSLMGLALIIGILVDDSIVVLENITRHRDLGEEPTDAAINGRSEIGGAAVAITMVDVVVFLPVAFMPGLVGMYLREFGAVIVVATLFSLFVSFTLTPLLAAKWSVLQRSMAPPKWMEGMRTWKARAGLLAACVLAFFIPWPLKELHFILPMMIVATVLLNEFVHYYDAIVEWYRRKALAWALDHGLFVVWVSTVLVLNAISLVAGGGMATVVIDVMLVAVAGIWHGIGWVIRRKTNAEALRLRGVAGANGKVQHIVTKHVPNAVANLLRLVGQWFYSTGRGRATVATFALPAALALCVPLLGAIDSDFVPQIQTGEINMTVTYPPGTPIATTQNFVNQLELGIMRIPGIKSVSSTVGSKPEGWGDLQGGNYAQLTAQTDDDKIKQTNRIIVEVRKLAYLVPGGDFQVQGDSGGGSGTAIFYSLSGPESEIEAAAEKVARFLRDTPGSVNVQTSAEVGAPRLNVNIDRQKAALLGVAPADAATAARLAIAGGVATRVRTENELVDVRVQFPPSERYSVDQLKLVRVRAADGTLVPLGAIADFEWTKAPTQVKRLNRARVVNVYGDVLPGYSLGSVTGPLTQKLNEPGFLPAGVTLTAQGDTQYMMETMANMGIALLTSFMLVYILMVILYGSFLEPFIVMFSVPCAIIGALFGLAALHKFDDLIQQPSGQSLNIISMIGIVMLFGLVSKNGILLVDYANTLSKRGMRIREAVLQSSGTRFRPILMTTCAMIFGMLPLALGFSEGGEWRQSMGTVIIGGLASSLILTLFLVPMIYNTWIGFLERQKDQRAIAAEMSQPATVTSR